MPLASTQNQPHLQSLYVSGFKSISAEAPQTFSFALGMNVVSGANGAGKSNVLDAILFGLTAGEGALRVAKMRQLLHSNGAVRAKCATVELTFATHRGPEVLTTRLHRDSDERRFKIQGKQHSLSEVRHYAETTLQINTTSLSFAVMQNKVVSFIGKPPTHLASIITQATGTEAFRRQLDSVKTSDIMQATADLSHLKQLLSTTRDALSDAATTLRVGRQLEEVQAEVHQTTSNLLTTRLRRVVEATQESYAAETEAAVGVSEVEARVEVLKESLASSVEEQRKHREGCVAPLCAEGEQLRDDLECAGLDVRHAENAIKNAEAEVSNQREELATQTKRLARIRSDLAIAQDIASTLRSALHNAGQNAATKDSIKTMQVSLKRLKKDLKDAEISALNVDREVQTKRARLPEVSIGRAGVDTQLQSAQRRVAQCEDSLSTAQHQVAKCRNQLARFSRLSEQGEGVVLDLLTLSPQGQVWADAINAVVGAKWGVEVCGSVQTVHSLLRVAKERKRTVTVWCLAQLAEAVPHPQMAAAVAAGGVPPHTLFTYAGHHKKVVSRLFRGTMLASSGSVKAILDLGFSVATQDGTLHNASSLSGGFLDSQSNPLAMKVQLCSALQEVSRCDSMLPELCAERDQLKGEVLRMKAATVEGDALRTELSSLETKARDAQCSVETLRREIAICETKLTTSEVAPSSEDVTKAVQKVESLQTDAAEAEAQRQALQDFAGLMPDPRTSHATLAQSLATKQSLHDKHTALTQRIADSERTSIHLASTVSSTTQSLAEANNTIKNLTTERNACKVRSVVLSREAAAIRKEMEGLPEAKEDKNEAFLTERLSSLRKTQAGLEAEFEARGGKGGGGGDTTDDTAAVAWMETLASLVESRGGAFETFAQREALLQSIDSPALREAADSCDATALAHCNERFAQYVKVLVPRFEKCRLKLVGEKVAEGVEVEIDDSSLDLFSGGQKTMVALAFLLAVASYNAAPFYLLDEVDAALDETNQALIATLVASSLSQRQVLCVTHHPSFRQHADKVLHLQNINGSSVLSHVSCAPGAQQTMKRVKVE